MQTNGGTKAIAHGLAQGGISRVMGGDFRSGFYGGSVSSLAGGLMQKTRGGGAVATSKRTMIAAASGGLAAQLGGGKFANGATTGAFVHLFNDEAWDNITIEEGPNGFSDSVQADIETIAANEAGKTLLDAINGSDGNVIR